MTTMGIFTTFIFGGWLFHHNVKPTCFASRYLGSYVPYQKLHSVNCCSFRGPISGGVSEMKVLSSVFFFSNVGSTGSHGAGWMAEIPNNHLGWIKPL